MDSRTPDHQLNGHDGARPSSIRFFGIDESEADLPDDGEHPRSWLAAYALGALDGDEREQVFLHVQRCDTCRTEVESFADVAAQLAWAAEPAPVPLRVRAAILHEIDDLARRGEGPMRLGAPYEQHRERPRIGGFHSWPRFPRIAVWSMGPVAAALVIVMVVVMVGIINRQQDALQEAEELQGETNRILADTDAPASDATFNVSADAGDARGRVVIDRELNRGMIFATNLTQTADGEVYVAWLQITGTDEFARAATVEVDDQGRGQAFLEPPDSLSRYSEISITLEPSPDSTYPTGPMLMTLRLVEPE